MIIVLVFLWTLRFCCARYVLESAMCATFADSMCQMKSKFSPTRTKLLCINSLPDDGQNFQQPDIWTRWKIPMYFPQHAPMLEPSVDRPLNPSTGEPSIGTRLSMEDFMSLRNFCIEIYQQVCFQSIMQTCIV